MTKQELNEEFMAMPNGWFIAFGKEIVDEIWETLVRYNTADAFYIDEIKEKFGSLRVYWDYICFDCPLNKDFKDAINGIIDKYEVISSNVCVICGRPDVPMTKKGWIIPICGSCWKESDLYGEYTDFVDLESNCTIPNYYRYTTYEDGKSVEYTCNIKKTVTDLRERYRKGYNGLHPGR